MSANLEDFLPGIFRRRKPLIIKDEWGGPSEQNLLDGSNVSRGEAPAVIPSSDTDSSPILDPTAANVGQDYSGTGLTRERRVETDNRGRPIPNITMAGDDQTVNYNKRLHAMQPQESQGWWDKWGKQGLLGALKGLAYGPGGALGGGLASGIRGATNPKLADEQWRAREIAKSDPEINRIAQTRQLQTKMAQEAASLGLTKARTEEIRNPKPKWTVRQDKAGIYHPVNPETGLDPQGNKVEGRAPADNDIELRVDESGMTVPVSKKTGLGADGKAVKAKSMVKQPDGTWIDPTEKYKADTAAGEANIINSAVRTNIAEMQAEKEKIAVALKNTAEWIDDGLGGQKPNPYYAELKGRDRKLDDDIRAERRRPKASPTSTTGDKKYKVYPKFLQ